MTVAQLAVQGEVAVAVAVAVAAAAVAVEDHAEEEVLVDDQAEVHVQRDWS